MRPLRPSGQFYVEAIGMPNMPDDEPCPVDNFYWMTNRGTRYRLTAHGGKWYVDVGRPQKPKMIKGVKHYRSNWKSTEVNSVAEALRLLADKLEQAARNRK
jgi:hypothetical protein